MTRMMKKTTREVDVIDKLFCNHCGKEIPQMFKEVGGCGDIECFASVDVTLVAGYGSKFDEDHGYVGDYCDPCAEKLIKEFGLKKKDS